VSAGSKVVEYQTLCNDLSSEPVLFSFGDWGLCV
jgi:hypothetical protein